MMDFILCFIAFLFALISLKWFQQTKKSTLPLPPGPKGYPIVGNLFQMPTITPWKTFKEWSKLHGDVMFLDLPNQPTVVLDSVEAAFELLEKRSDIYSDRPVSIMQQLAFWDWSPGFLRYSQHWRNHRRELHQFFNQHEVAKYQPIQLRECRAFLRRALHSPNILDQHVRHIFTAIIMKITYDMDITEMDSEHVLLAQEANLALSIVTMPGVYWVDHFPFLKYLPKWLPGLQFKKIAEYYRPLVEKMRSQPFDEILQAMREGRASSSLTSKLIERLQQRSGKTNLSTTDDELARNVTGVVYSAAADTTTSAAQSFLIAMSLYPGVQRKAQEELDRVVGPNRLPEFSDYDDLVYIQAIAIEALRWMVVLPLSAFHSVTRDDTYRGFLIPKGTTVIANAWAMLHDPKEYPEPTRFKPERHLKDGKLNPTVRNPNTIAFGFGRRICPGRHLGSASLFMTIASILHTFDIHEIPDEDGKSFDPFSSVVTGLISTPDRVPCKLIPRSDDRKQLIDTSI